MNAPLRWLTTLPSRTFWALAAFVGLALRLPLLLMPVRPISDGYWYHQAALSLATGHGLTADGAVTAYRPPGYPFLLSLAYRAFGPHLACAWLWGLLFTALLVAAVHALARRWHGLTTARVAVLLLLLYPELIVETALPMSDLAFTAGLAALVWFVEVAAPRPRTALLAGLLVAALTLIRGVGLGLVLWCPLAWCLRGEPRRAAQGLLLSGLALALALAPWALRNRQLFGRPLLATNTGINLYIGHHAGATGTYVPLPENAVPPEARQNEADSDAALTREAVQYALGHPLAELLLLPRKLAYLFLEETSAPVMLFQRQLASVRRYRFALYLLTQAGYFVLVFLALRGRQFSPAGWATLVYVALIGAIFFGDGRFRLPLLPWLTVAAAVTLTAPRRPPQPTPRQTS